MDVFSFALDRNSEIENYTSTQDLLTKLIKTVANGGNYLLDIGPTYYGRIPINMQDSLLEIGAWLKVNGEAIYNTTIWTVQNEIDHVTYYTQGLTAVYEIIIFIFRYAITTAWPDNNQLVLHYPVPTVGTKVFMLGYASPLKWNYSPSIGFSITIPYIPPPLLSPFAWTFKMVNINGPPPLGPLQGYWSNEGRADNAECGTQACVEALEQEAEYL